MPPAVLFGVACDGDVYRVLGQSVGHILAPLHGAYAAALQIVVPADVKEGVLRLQPVHVKVEEGGGTAVFIDDGEGGAGDAAAASKTTGKAAGEGRFAHTQTAQIGHHAAARKAAAQLFADGFRFFHAVGQIFHAAHLAFF